MHAAHHRHYGPTVPRQRSGVARGTTLPNVFTSPTGDPRDPLRTGPPPAYPLVPRRTPCLSGSRAVGSLLVASSTPDGRPMRGFWLCAATRCCRDRARSLRSDVVADPVSRSYDSLGRWPPQFHFGMFDSRTLHCTVGTLAPGNHPGDHSKFALLLSTWGMTVIPYAARAYPQSPIQIAVPSHQMPRNPQLTANLP